MRVRLSEGELYPVLEIGDPYGDGYDEDVPDDLVTRYRGALTELQEAEDAVLASVGKTMEEIW